MLASPHEQRLKRGNRGRATRMGSGRRVVGGGKDLFVRVKSHTAPRGVASRVICRRQ